MIEYCLKLVIANIVIAPKCYWGGRQYAIEER